MASIAGRFPIETLIQMAIAAVKAHVDFAQCYSGDISMIEITGTPAVMAGRTRTIQPGDLFTFRMAGITG